MRPPTPTPAAGPPAAGWRHPELLARALPFGVFIALLALRGLAQTHPLAGLDSRWLYGLGVLAAGALLWAWRRRFGELAWQNRPTGPQALAAVLAGLAVFALWVTLDAPWMSVGQPSASFVPLTPEGRLDPALVAVRVCGAVLLVPVMEELFWRSFLMRWLQQASFTALAPQAVGLRAVLLSTFVFTLAHPQWLAAAIAGLVYAGLYLRTGRLWNAVLAHAVTNAALAAWVLHTGRWGYW